MGTYWVEPQIPRKLCDTKFVDSLCLAKYSVCLVAGGWHGTAVNEVRRNAIFLLRKYLVQHGKLDSSR